VDGASNFEYSEFVIDLCHSCQVTLIVLYAIYSLCNAERPYLFSHLIYLQLFSLYAIMDRHPHSSLYLKPTYS
jgi:hypothetical protein